MEGGEKGHRGRGEMKERGGWGPGSSLSCSQVLSGLQGPPLRLLLCAWAGCHSWYMQLITVVLWGWR